MNPNTIRAVYRRLADAGYVTSRHGAGTHVADRPPQRRGAEALAGIVAEMLRRAAAGRVHAPTRSPRPRSPRPPSGSGPGPLVQVLFAECTNADAGYDAERLADAFADSIDVEGALLDDLPERLDRFHYDLVATTTFHADEAQALVHGRVPVVAMLVGPGYLELVHEIAALPPGSRVGLVCASERGAENIAETLALSGTTGRRDRLGDDGRRATDLDLIDRTADVILLSREAIANGLDERFDRPERIRAVVVRVRPVRASSCSAAAIEHVDDGASSGGGRRPGLTVLVPMP